jgi:hypothetical protein
MQTPSDMSSPMFFPHTQCSAADWPVTCRLRRNTGAVVRGAEPDYNIGTSCLLPGEGIDGYTLGAVSMLSRLFPEVLGGCFKRGQTIWPYSLVGGDPYFVLTTQTAK